MAIIWPLELPQKVLKKSFGETSSPNIISTNFEIGAPQIRPRSTFQGKSYTCSIQVDLSNKLLFEQFYQYTTLSGTQAFEFPDFYIENVIINVKFSPKTTPAVTSIGGGWVEISFSLDLQP